MDGIGTSEEKKNLVVKRASHDIIKFYKTVFIE